MTDYNIHPEQMSNEEARSNHTQMNVGMVSSLA